MSIDMDRLQGLMGKFVNEMGAAQNAALVILGEELGLFRALAAHGPCSSTELAAKCGLYERYVREWLGAQSASGFVDYDEHADQYFMSPEQEALLADQDSSTYLAGGFQSLAAAYASLPRLTQAFRSGQGIAWQDQCACLFCGTESFYRSGYRASLLSEWIPAIEGMHERLSRGAKVVDIGCGHGAATLILADAYPRSRFLGIDLHPQSIAHANDLIKERLNVSFQTARAEDFAGQDFDLATMFDALHDMGDPVAAARQARRSLGEDGVLMLVEPNAGDKLSENLNPVGRIYYAASTHFCVPNAVSQAGPDVLGAQAGMARLSAVLSEAGFAQVRQAARSAFNLVVEAR